MNDYIKIDIKNTYDTIFEGFGTSLSWFANAIGKHQNNEIKNHLCNILFDQNDPNSLQLNIVRYNIGGVIDNKKKAIFRNGGDIPGYNMNNKKKWNETDLGQRYFLKKAKELGVNIFEAFSNSPPENLTISNGVEGNKYRCMNNIKSNKIEDFTDYLINVTTFLKKNDDIEFKTISPMNEPSGPGWIEGCGQEGCFYNFGIRQKLLKSIYKKTRNHSLNVSACEENNMLQALFGILINPFMWKYVDQYNIHRYTIDNALKFNTFNLEDSNILRRIIYIIMNKIYKKKIWMSEWGTGNSKNLSEIDTLLKFANSIIDDFNYLHPSAWIYWQVIEDLSTNGWGCLQIPFNNPNIKNIVYNVQFTTFQHFTHYIKPGSKFLKLQKPKNKNIKWIGCINQNKISLIILSKNKENIYITFNKYLYNISMMCSYNLHNNITIDKKNIPKLTTLTVHPFSLTSLSFNICTF